MIQSVIWYWIKDSIPCNGQTPASMRLSLKVHCYILTVLQIEYVNEPSQLEFLRLLSDRARQRIKYNCKDSVAWGDENRGFSKSLKIKADNGVEMHAESSNKFKPKLILDDCSVSKSSFYATKVMKLRIEKTKSVDWLMGD